MKKRLLVRNPISLISLTTVVSFILLLLLYGTIKFEEKIEKKILEISTADIISIVNNNISYIKTILKNENYIEEIKTNEKIQKKIENRLESLVTSNIKYSYLLYKDSRGIFRFLADGALIDEKAILDQKFDIDSSQWIDIFETKKPLSIRS
ncbi:MAG: hypothetical protein U5K55_13945 [Aliarcobacter sp.]|nr:hypothetical protein [Aliarcobacter sp.]